jgi:hypothetical protein
MARGSAVGYGRVCTRDQHPESEHDATHVARCEPVFIDDKASGNLARRPELEKALLSANRSGDQLVVTKLDRLGRSLEHVIELSKLLESRGVDLVVLDQGIDTSTSVGRMHLAAAQPSPPRSPGSLSGRTRRTGERPSRSVTHPHRCGPTDPTSVITSTGPAFDGRSILNWLNPLDLFELGSSWR